MHLVSIVCYTNTLSNKQLFPGRLDLEENLLHLCMRQRLEETAMALLQPQCVEGKAFYILQKARIDNKTPLDIARKNGMKKAVELAEMAMVRNVTFFIAM